MSIEKSLLKKAAYEESAQEMEKAAWQAERDMWKCEGAREVLTGIEKQFNLLCTAVRNELMKAEEMPFDPKNLPEVGQWVNTRIQKGNQKIHEAMLRAYEAGMRLEGQKKAFGVARDRALSMAKNEEAKIEQSKAEEAENQAEKARVLEAAKSKRKAPAKKKKSGGATITQKKPKAKAPAKKRAKPKKAK